MDEIIPGLWIGNLPSAQNTQLLKDHGIYSILSAMRGRITINETFIRHQILLDDTEDADVLVHLLPSIHFIEAELGKGRGVLVHCQAGISRSATIVAAYLMYSRDLDTNAALELIKKARPNIEPNDNFLQQLEIFHKAQYKISRKDKSTRMYYMERVMHELLNGDGSLVETDMFARYPDTPGGPRSRIRCKMCRQELASREHMLDHGQLGPPTPAILSPASSRRPSFTQLIGRRPSIPQARSRHGSLNDARPRRLSLLGLGGLGGALSMSSMDSEHAIDDDDPDHGAAGSRISPIANGSHFGDMRRRMSGTKTPPMPQISEALKEVNAEELSTEDGAGQAVEQNGEANEDGSLQSTMSMEDAKTLGQSLSDAVLTQANDKKPYEPSVREDEGVSDKPLATLVSPTELAAQLYSNPKLAALRPPTGAISAASGPRSATPVSPPILINPKCSGYFVEPMAWMEPFLEAGDIAGKIICPKCGAKLGNYDWAGMKCGCREWVVPGFCINRAKVDEMAM
ncbi:hypothetical protein AX15_000395 [Amanita polypyramis BW_CC]|nr:hypothetical protein AX15_000395 [Amanita polypyramis BW_CC]